MTLLRSLLSRLARDLLSRGVISRGWDSMLTGATLLYLVWVLRGSTTDPVVPWVMIGFAVGGVYLIERGFSWEIDDRVRQRIEEQR